MIHLKINFNSTRRALWYAKLGYQPIPGPFPIKIRTAHELGGVIGAINICVVRCYPVKYLERYDSYSGMLYVKFLRIIIGEIKQLFSLHVLEIGCEK